MAIEYFCCYHSYIESLEPLNDAEKGRLFMACLTYSKLGEVPQLSGNERFVFPMFKAQIDRDNAKYSEKCKKQSENARMRWHATACDGMPTHANTCQTCQGKGKGKGKGKESPLTPKGDEKTAFEIFWDAYPKKKGKAKAMDAFAKAIKKTDLDTMLAAIEAQKLSHDWQKENGQFIPYPSSWLNGCRWEDEVAQVAPAAYIPLPDNIPDNGW